MSTALSDMLHVQRLNQDLKVLYSIARAVIPKDILEALLYEEPEEPNEVDMNEVYKFIQANRHRMENPYEFNTSKIQTVAH